MRSLAALGLFLVVFTGSAAADIDTLRTFDPRPFGYFVGDTIERSFEIDTGATDRLEPASLPRPGALNYWLEIRDVGYKTTATSGGATHTIMLVYQMFYAPIDPRKISIPDTRISIATAKGAEQVTLPGFTFIASPIREIFPEKSGETSDTFLRPDPAPLILSEISALRRFAALSAAGLLVLGLLARQLGWWPFHRRRVRPFSRAAGEIAHVLSGSTGTSGAAYRDAALILHRAFDESAGERLFASDIDRFLAHRPEHQTSAGDIARFFEASRALFFGSSSGETLPSEADIRGLASRLRSEERGAR